MGMKMGGLSPAKIREVTEPGLYADGGGLYLQVRSASSKSWIFRYSMNKKRRDMGLGPVDLSSHIMANKSLSAARARAADLRLQVSQGKDPIALRDAERETEPAKVKTFAEAAEEFIQVHEAGWKNPKHAIAWRNSLKNHAYPILKDCRVSEISQDMVLRVLEPIWKETPETSKRLQERIAKILGRAKALGYRTGDNPAAWKDNLEHMLPARSKARSVSHMPAMAIDELPDFFLKLKATKDWGSVALQFLILTATRNQETRLATWSEFDMEKRVWTIPADRMKMGRIHRVPLSDPAIEVLRYQWSISRSQYVFPGRLAGRPISDMTILQMMRRFGRSEVPHGFRSTFKDWAAERTDYPGEVSEMALAHAVGDKVEAAYRRGDLLEKRIQIMNDWAAFCLSKQTSELKLAVPARPELQLASSL